MDRREFFKITAATGGTAALSACGHPENQLIRFIPEEELNPGIAKWKPSVCTLCPAGCGLQVRVMEGDAEVVRDGRRGVMAMGLAKKLEGNPNHPVNHGKLCARGQAGLQVTYNPDRLTNPLKRSGARGSGEFAPVSWDEALKELTDQLAALGTQNAAASLAFLSRPLSGQRRVLMEKFLAAFGAAPAMTYEFFDESVLRRANALSFGHEQLPTIDLGNSNYVLSFGADFLGTWNSPVSQSVGYGTMRQGRMGLRGRMVQVEPRMSQTGANADQWVAVRPGTEGALALGIAHLIMQSGIRKPGDAGVAGERVAGWANGLPEFTADAVEKVTGVPAATLAFLARDFSSNPPAVAIISGAALAQTNGLLNALAVNALNALLGSVGKPGGINFTPGLSLDAFRTASSASASSLQSFAGRVLSGEQSAKALLLYGANPVFTAPRDWKVRVALEKIPFIASFGSFLDETSILADLILPDHSPLESWLDDVPESGAIAATLSLAAPAMIPLHNTRSMPEVLLDLARRLGGKVAAALPDKTFDEMLRAVYTPLMKQNGSITAKSTEDFFSKLQDQGGWWSSEVKTSPINRHAAAAPPAEYAAPQSAGDPSAYPFQFLPYASQQFYDGSLANLPWMQEMPEVLSTAMWGTWLEINPAMAEKLGIEEGDLVEVASERGKIRAPALVFPGIAPDVVAMPMGQGHEFFGRYANGRGANPAQILAPLTEPETGALAWAATRVKISRVGKGELILFAGGLREWPRENRRR